MILQHLAIITLNTAAVIIVLHIMRKCYLQKSWLFFFLEAILLIAVVATIAVE